MELNREQVINEIDERIKYAKFIGTNNVVLSANAAQYCIEFTEYYEQKIKELTVELEAMRTAANSIKIHNEKLAEENERLKARVFEENHLRHQAEEMLANGMSVVKSDTVREMQERLKAEFADDSVHGQSEIYCVIDHITNEILGENK